MEQWDGRGQGLDGLHRRVVRPQDRLDLPGDQAREGQQPDQQQDDGDGVELVVHRKGVVQHHEHGDGQESAQDRLQQEPAACSRGTGR